mgnify:CR=1 FL=1
MIKIENYKNIPSVFFHPRNFGNDVHQLVAEIIHNVRVNGDKALKEYSERFDQGCPSIIEIPKEDLEKCAKQLNEENPQLYEALGEGLLIFILATYSIFKKKTVIHSPGKLSCNFLIFYGIMRCFLELFREPDAPLICNLSRGQFYSIFVILVGALLKLYVKKHPISQNRCIFKSRN